MNSVFALAKPIARCMLAAALAAAAFASPTSPPKPAAAAPPVVLVVDLSSDLNVTTCTAAPADCTLRGAINRLTLDATEFGEITFSPLVTLTVLINPLPPIVMTGTSIVGNSGAPRLDGILMTNGSIFSVTAPYAGISGLSIVNGHGFGDGIFADIWVAEGQGVSIYGNYLGTLPPSDAVTNCTPNPDGGSLVSRNSGYGVYVSGSVFGTSAAGAGSVYIHGNTIGCHDGHGIVLDGSDYVHIGEDGTGFASGNFIGVNVNGATLPNGAGGIGDGIDLVAATGGNGARNNRIRANTIAGNGRYGILLFGTGANNTNSTSGNLLIGNRIGNDDFGQLANGSDGVFLGNGAFLNTIGGTADADRNVISGNAGDGIRIVNSTGTGILGNYIGTSRFGTLDLGNAGNGVHIDGSNATFVGGYFLLLAAAFRENIISGNGGNGVLVNGSSTDTLIAGNRIGLSVGGASAIGNDFDGIQLTSLSGGGVITGNVVSGNVNAGIHLDSSSGVSITHNYVGTTAAGSAALGNGKDGVQLDNGSSVNWVGGPLVTDRNVISGNEFCGVYINDASNNNLIDFNLIGTNAAGTSAVPNVQDGVCIFDGSTSNFIGSAGPSAAQYISGNLLTGVFITGSDDNAIYESNRIGIGADASPMGNGREGVLINNASQTRAYPTLVAYNGGAGLAVVDDASASNDLGPHVVRYNGGLPIDLGNNGPTANDAGDADTGPNDELNYPVITSAAGSPVTLQGTTCANCSVYVYSATGNPGGPGGGAAEIPGMLTVANGSGDWSIVLPLGLTRFDITLQALDTAQNASEYSPRYSLDLPITLR